jgi:outer membrane beta-barrel protein
MESRIRSIFLVPAIALSFCAASVGLAQEGGAESEAQPRVIEPDVERRPVDVSKIDTEDFELTGFVGIMSVEDFGSDVVYGARFAYHINETFFAEATYGSTEAGETSFEVLNPSVDLLPGGRDFNYYDLSLGYNILPGEVFFGSSRAFVSSFYLIGGLGSVDFNDANEFSINFGFGMKILPTDYLAIRLDARDYLVDVEITGEKKTTHNLQGTFNVSWYF